AVAAGQFAGGGDDGGAGGDRTAAARGPGETVGDHVVHHPPGPVAHRAFVADRGGDRAFVDARHHQVGVLRVHPGIHGPDAPDVAGDDPDVARGVVARRPRQAVEVGALAVER